MRKRRIARWLQFAFVALTLATPAAAVVTVDLGRVVADADGKAIVEVRLHGENVGGVQNDILFDPSVVRLESAARCRINPAIGDRAAACETDPVSGPCKTLSRHLASCASAPTPPGCEGTPAGLSRFRAIVAATAVPNNNFIPDGAVLYTCEFDVLDRTGLPALLSNSNIAASDPTGVRLDSGGTSGFIAADESQTPPPTPTAPPTATETATRTPPPPTATRPPSLELRGTYVGVSFELSVILHSGGQSVAGLQSDIWFEGSVLQLEQCRLDPVIDTTAQGCDSDPATSPCKTLTMEEAECSAEPLPSGCDGQSASIVRLRTVIASTEAPSLIAIPDGTWLYTCTLTFQGPMRANEIRLGNTVASDPYGNGVRLDTSGAVIHIFDPLPEIRPLGFPCDNGEQCLSGFCVDRTCCSTASCAPNQFCNVSTDPGSCSPRFELESCCNQDSDCRTDNCAADSPARPQGCFGVCGPQRTPTPLAGGASCDSDEDCVSGFRCNRREGRICCEQQECADGTSCRVPGSEGFCRPLPTATATRLPVGAPCSPNRPEVCPTGYCVNDTCCAEARCLIGERCDILGEEGRCLPPLQEGYPCEENTDCLPGLRCLKDGERFRCTYRLPSPTPIRTGAPTATVAVDGGWPYGRDVGDSGCSMTQAGSTGWLLWPLAALLLGRSVFTTKVGRT